MFLIRKRNQTDWQECSSIETWGEFNLCSVDDILEVKNNHKVNKYKIVNIEYQDDDKKWIDYIKELRKKKQNRINKEVRPLVYVAIPYSHSDKKIMQFRFKLANKITADLMKEGFCVYSPISHNHSLAQSYDLPRTWDFWKKFDLTFLKLAYKLIVIKAEGWEKSIGVQAEIEFAQKEGLEIEYLDIN